ncbi:MAG TPA: choice-of-anchor tandem repeat NxxGxxAF-containing protein [Ideonella sp.]|nr:choice-of-anchor tandem repeat NxxGxxAF-containing protein [Ideonella sp.]
MKPLIRNSLATLALAAAASSWADAGAYHFTPLIRPPALADTPELAVPALADDGRAAIAATLVRLGSRVLRTDAGIRPTVIAGDKRFSRFGSLSIGARGEVAFEASLEKVTGEGIFRGDGSSIVQIAGTRDAGDFDFVNSGPSVNASGQVAFIGERIVGGAFIDGVYTGNGGPVQAVYDVTGPFRDFTGNPAINDSGTVAFLATLRNGVGGLFLGTGGNDLVRVADDTGPLTGIVGFSDPSLNDKGEVAFQAGTNPDFDDNGASTGTGIFLYAGGRLSAVVQGGFAEFLSLGTPSLNNVGQVAFVVEPTFGNRILVTGPDLVGDRVIGTGDILQGRVVDGLAFSREGLNDAGQLAFIAFFRDGSSAPYLATPVSRR